MTAEDALAALTEHWDDVIARLDVARAQELRDLITQLGGPGHTAAVVRVTQLLGRELPADHPVRRALARGYLYAGRQADWLALRQGLLAAAGPALTELGLAGDTGETPGDGTEASRGQDGGAGRAAGDVVTPQDILTEVTGRLLRAPALTADEVRLRGADPADPGLIRLDRPDGGQQWLSFQFAPGGGALSIVRTINAMLGAEADPLGVADWWLGVNAWLGGRPSDLIGDVPDEALLRAAHAVTEEV